MMPGTLTHPMVNPGNLPPASMPPAAIAISSIPILADIICLELAWLKTGAGRYMISNKAKIARLKRQLPKRSPKARSGSLTKATALTPVTSSGMEVIAARSSRPIHILPRPVFSAIASPYRASLVPANRMIARQAANFNQTKTWGSMEINNVLQAYNIGGKPVKI